MSAGVGQNRQTLALQGLRARGKRAALRRLRNYVAERVSLRDYAACRANPPRRAGILAAARAESQCKTTTSRLKGSGMRWAPRNAEALLALTAFRDSRE